jgi:hypothetical protein
MKSLNGELKHLTADQLARRQVRNVRQFRKAMVKFIEWKTKQLKGGGVVSEIEGLGLAIVE